MIKKKIKAISIIALVCIININAISILNISKTEAIDPFFTLVFKTNGGGVRPDYGNFLRQHLARIGIDIDVIVQDWPTFIGELIAFRDFDICYVALQKGMNNKDILLKEYGIEEKSIYLMNPDLSNLYSENGSHNLFGYHTSMDWDEEFGTGKNEWYLQQVKINSSTDTDATKNLYWDWEQYFMDKICALAPTFTQKIYVATWSNLNGYNYSEGILQSWGKMWFDGSHTGQISTDELVIADADWSDLNPLNQSDSSSSFISSAIMDPLVWIDADLSVWPHLAESYEYINDTTIEIICRDGIKWQTDSDGLFPNEYFDAEDVYFTIQTWRTISNEQYNWDWIKSMQIIDDMTLRINIVNDFYSPRFSDLAIKILPEHYLNQTQLADGVTPDISDPSWNTYATNAFGTGLFKISDIEKRVETTLVINSNSWWINNTITNDSSLNWRNRFGFDTLWDTNGINQLRIRVIPDLLTINLEFEDGKLDIESITPFHYKIEDYILNENYIVQDMNSSSFEFYGFNIRETREYIGDRRASNSLPDYSNGLCIRKAISYAIDRTEINNVIHVGEYSLYDWPIYPNLNNWCKPNIIRYTHNLDKAREYLYHAGFDCVPIPQNDFDGLLGFIISMSILLGYSGLLMLNIIVTITTAIIHKKAGNKKRRWEK